MPGFAPFYKRTALAAAIAAAFPGAALAASVARVDFAIGNVTAVAPDGRSRPLARGSEIEVGDTVATQQGRAQLRFTDGAYMSLQPGTEFKVDEYKFSGRADGEENVIMSLLKGGMRTITGLIGRLNRDKYKLRTEVATIGIRGTEYSVSYTNSINVFCADGSIAVENDAGVLVLNGGEGGFVSASNAPPTKTEDKPFLPPQSGGGGEEVAPPTNALQDAAPGLTGDFTGNWAASLQLDAYEGTTVSSATEKAIVMNANGELVKFEGSVNEIGTATAQSLGNDGIIAWGRWVSGTTSGNGVFSNQTLSNGPLHYVVALPTGTLPASGSATYDMIGFSASCTGGNCTSMVVSGSKLSVDFGASSVGMDMSFSVNGDYAGSYTFSSSGYGSSLSGARITGISGSLSGPASGSMNAQGFLGGPGGSRAGMAWNGSIYGGSSTMLSGVTAYKKQ